RHRHEGAGLDPRRRREHVPASVLHRRARSRPADQVRHDRVRSLDLGHPRQPVRITMTRLALLALLFTAACADDDPAPTVSVRSATPDSLTPDDDRLDDLTITIDYTDADGDLGGGTAEIHDCRSDALVTILDIPAIAPDDIVDGDA